MEAAGILNNEKGVTQIQTETQKYLGESNNGAVIWVKYLQSQAILKKRE